MWSTTRNWLALIQHQSEEFPVYNIKGFPSEAIRQAILTNNPELTSSLLEKANTAGLMHRAKNDDPLVISWVALFNRNSKQKTLDTLINYLGEDHEH